MFDWLVGSQPAGPAPKAAADGKPQAPDRSAREQCYQAREAFFKCLDANGIIDSVKDKDAAAKYCGADLKGFEANCAASWVDYFKRRRVMEYEKNRVLEKMEADNATRLEGELPPNLRPK
ncbi:MAG: hypothetical protein M1814_006871 [Vezdaea aestivalis]|nr:MAG: hypothetical protein M1814_006871 [Vezdaea aestivalis]